MAKVKIDVKDLKQFIRKVDKLGDNILKDEVVLWLDASGMQFLEEVQNMIKSMQVVDTRRLLNSFDKGNDSNVWTIKHGGLKLEVGTNVEYARWVNDGHFTDKPGRARRWIPGYWKGDRFVYEPNSSEGMSLKFQWVEGKPYWDNAVVVFEKMFEQAFRNKLKQWAKRIRL